MLFLILIVDIVVANPLNETVDVDSSNNETLSKTNNETLSKAWNANNWDETLRWWCPNNRPISRIQSEHSSWYGDRRFDYRCEAHPLLSGVSPTCRWTPDYINNHGDSMFYSCGGASYVSGFKSIHSNWYEDRRWRVKCCSGSGTCLTECDFTGTSQAQVVIKDCKTEISKMGSPTTNSDSLVKGLHQWLGRRHGLQSSKWSCDKNSKIRTQLLV